MKLVRTGTPGQEKPGIVINNICYDVSDLFADYDAPFFENGGIAKLHQIPEITRLPVLENIRYGCPVGSPSKIVCIGLNYIDHARETGATPPQEPVIFLKSTTAITGPFDDVMLPEGSLKTDWEVELAIVIGKKARYVEEKEAMEYVAGYCLHNDISERAFQLERGGTWDKGKGCDSFAPLGPWLVTPDEIPDVHNLNLWLRVNGKTVQNGSTANLIFKVPFLIAYVSRFMTLLPGDIISTGTPAGVGMGMKPPVFLQAGDVMELGIDGLGTASQKVIEFKK